MGVNYPRVSAAVAAALVLAACSGASGSAQSSSAAGPVTASTLSSELGCPRPPGNGGTVNGSPGLSYQCVWVPNSDPAKLAMIDFVIFQSQGDEDIWAKQSAGVMDPKTNGNGQMAVLGPLWAVWGTDQATISKAVNLGGKLM